MNQPFFWRVAVYFQVALAAPCGQSATNGVRQEPRPKNGIVEYQELTRDAVRVVSDTLGSVGRLAEQTNRIPSKISGAFFKAVERLQVESLRVRERAQAILVRGDAYFENWQTNLARIENPSVRQLAQEHRVQLEQSFGKIKQDSHETKQVFEAFFSDLRKLRIAVENDPSTMASASSRELAHNILNEGRRVQEGLAGIRDQLSLMMGLLTPAKSGARS